MNLVEQAQLFLEKKGYIVESEDTGLPDDFTTEGGANVFYYIGRLIENKGPQTEGSLEKYLETKFDVIPYVELKRYSGKKIYWMNFLSSFFYKDGRRWDFTADGHDWWQEVAEWHDNKMREEDPYAAVVKMFWDWYKAKKAGNNDEPDDEVINFVNKAAPATIERAFGKYYKFAMGLLEPYMKNSQLTDEDRMIQKFWDWHRAKKAGKPYQLDQDTIDGLVVFLRKPKAVEVLQQYYYYFVRVIENLSDKNIKTPINTDGLQKELKRIMDNLDNDEFVDELEKIERNRLHGGDMTAGPVFVLPVDVIKTIRTLAKDDDNIVKSKVGKIDKDQVKECYTYCNNELNRKFHIGKTGIFDLNIQDFYDTYKIVFQRGFNQKTLHKIFDEVCQYLLDQLDKGTAEYWKNRGKIEVEDVDDFNEAYRLLKNAGYRIVESAEDDAEEGILSVWDREKIMKGQTPSWAKSVTDVKPKNKRVKGSSDWTEKAMRGVTNRFEPQTEDEWRLDNEWRKSTNQQLADLLKKHIDCDMKVDKECITIYPDDDEVRFEVYPGGFEFMVKKINVGNFRDREIFTDEKLKKCIEWIKERI